MENMRTLAFQVPESLFQQIKDYLNRNHITQKQFVIGLIQTEINRDLEQRQSAEVSQETSTEAASQVEQEDDELTEDDDLVEDESDDEAFGMSM